MKALELLQAHEEYLTAEIERLSDYISSSDETKAQYVTRIREQLLPELADVRVTIERIS